MSRRTTTDWSHLISRYRKSGETQSAFCNRHGVALGTLQYHLRKERSVSVPTALASTGFIDISPERASGVVEIELSLPNGAVLRVRG